MAWMWQIFAECGEWQWLWITREFSLYRQVVFYFTYFIAWYNSMLFWWRHWSFTYTKSRLQATWYGYSSVSDDVIMASITQWHGRFSLGFLFQSWEDHLASSSDVKKMYENVLPWKLRYNNNIYYNGFSVQLVALCGVICGSLMITGMFSGSWQYPRWL